MPWAKFSDKTHRNRKVRRVARKEPSAALLWMFAVIYCCEQMTDGEIEGDELRELLPRHHEDYVRLLVSERLLHDRPGCQSPDCLGSQGLPLADTDMFVVHDFAATQMTTDQWAEFEQRKKDKSKFAAHKRWHLDRGVVADDCDLCTDARGNATGNA